MSKEYELIQDDVCVAATSGDSAKKEIEKYATMYGQDGPVEIYEVTRVKIYPVSPEASLGLIDYLYLNLDTMLYVDSQEELVKQIGVCGVLKSFIYYPEGIAIVGSKRDFTEVQAKLAAKKIREKDIGKANAQLAKALEMAVRQNEHEMLMTGEECRQCRAALAAAGVKP